MILIQILCMRKFLPKMLIKSELKYLQNVINLNQTVFCFFHDLVKLHPVSRRYGKNDVCYVGRSRNKNARNSQKWIIVQTYSSGPTFFLGFFSPSLSLENMEIGNKRPQAEINLELLSYTPCTRRKAITY